MTYHPFLWSIEELLTARRELQRDFTGSSKNYRIVINSQIREIDAELKRRES